MVTLFPDTARNRGDDFPCDNKGAGGPQLYECYEGQEAINSMNATRARRPGVEWSIA